MNKQLKRAETHEKMLRERLSACRRSEEHTRVQARLSADTAKQRVGAALFSRGRLASRVVSAAERSGHRCAATMIANDADVREWARRDAQMRTAQGYWDQDDEEIA